MMNGRMVGIGGRTGFGKSSLARSLISGHARVIILENSDAKNEYDAERFASWPEMLMAFWKCGSRGPKRFRVSIACGTTYFPHVLALAWALGDVLVVVEEAGKYFGPGVYYQDVRTGRNVAVPREFVEICERGRHAGPGASDPISVLMIAQAPARLPRVFRQEMARFYAFRLTAKEDRDWLKDFPGAGSEVAERSALLEKFSYLNIDADGGCSLEKTLP